LRVAVNLSARQFQQADLDQCIAEILLDTGLQPAFLELEITENTIMRDLDRTASHLRNLKELGVHLSIDDFGTGHSSLNYLKRFAVDTLKIDRSFVRDIHEDANDAAIVRAVVAMAHSLKLRVVAEGVETEAQLAFLRSLACNEMQGYLFSKPLPAEQATAFLANGARMQPSNIQNAN
jgi:EAL domain-containing protein (putative c-di-GMP-specific phosphodiesterase class I)